MFKGKQCADYSLVWFGCFWEQTGWDNCSVGKGDVQIRQQWCHTGSGWIYRITQQRKSGGMAPVLWKGSQKRHPLSTTFVMVAGSLSDLCSWNTVNKRHLKRIPKGSNWPITIFTLRCWIPPATERHMSLLELVSGWLTINALGSTCTPISSEPFGGKRCITLQWWIKAVILCPQHGLLPKGAAGGSGQN